MPAPKNAAIPEFYVYRLEVGGIPFYVGVGRAARASDRVRYVRSLMEREKRGEHVEWDLSCEVVAELLRLGHEVSVSYAATCLVRADAVERERRKIARLLAEGFMLANIHHNPFSPQSAAEVVSAVIGRLPTAGDGSVATRNDWKATPLPAARKLLPVERTYSAAEFERIKAGSVPQEMEDKWFAFYEQPWFYLHRSWTGFCVYQLQFESTGDGVRITQVFANRDPDEYSETDDARDALRLTELLDHYAGRPTEDA